MSEILMTPPEQKCAPKRVLSKTELEYCHDYFEQLFHSKFFKGLNDETRQKIVLLVGQNGEDGMCVAEIAGHFSLDRTTISHHLALLRDSRILILAKRGKEHYYSLNVQYVVGALKEMMNILNSCYAK